MDRVGITDCAAWLLVLDSELQRCGCRPVRIVFGPIRWGWLFLLKFGPDLLGVIFRSFRLHIQRDGFFTLISGMQLFC